MAIVVGAATQFNTVDTVHGSVSETYDAGAAATDRLLLVTVYCQENSSNGGVASVTYDGVGLTLVASKLQFAGASSAQSFVLAAPATGSNTLLVTFDNDMNGSVVVVQVLTGVDQANPVNDTAVSGNLISTDVDLTVTSDVADCVFFMASTARNIILGDAGNAFTDEVDTVASAGTELVDDRIAAGFASVGPHLFHTDELSLGAHDLTSITTNSNRRIGIAWALAPSAGAPATPEGNASLDVGAIGFTGSGAVASAVVGTGSLSLGSIGFSGSGAVNQVVAGDATLDLGSVGLAGSGAITAPVLGSGELSVGTVALSGSGLVSGAVLGTGSFDIQSIGLSGSGSVTALVSGTASIDLGSIEFAGTGTTAAVVTGTASFDIGSIALSGAGTIVQNITAELEAEAEFASIMSVNVTAPLTAIAAAEIEATLEPQIITAVQGTGILSLDAIGLGGGGQVTPTVFGNGTLPLSIITFVGAGILGAFIGGTGTLDLDDVGLSGSGSVAPIVQGTANLDIGSIELSGQGAVASIVAGSGSLPIAAVNVSGSGSVLAIPVGQASLDIADIGLAGAGQVLSGIVGQGSFNVGALNIAGAGSVVSGLVGQGTFPVPGPAFNGSGSIGALVSGQGSLSVSAVALAGSGQVTAVPQGQASLDIGGITLAGSGLVSQGPSGVGSLEVGAVSISGSGSILAPVSGSGQFTVAEVTFLGQGSTTGVIDGSFIFDIGAIQFNGAGITGDKDAETTELPPRDVEYILYDVDLEGQSGQNLEEEFRLMGSKVAVYDVQRFQGESVDYSLDLARDFTTGVYTLIASRKRDPDPGDPTIFTLNGVVDSQDQRRILFTPDAAAIALEKGVYYLFAWEELNGDVRLASAASLIIKNAAQI